jgi:hypothetical protein
VDAKDAGEAVRGCLGVTLGVAFVVVVVPAFAGVAAAVCYRTFLHLMGV